MKTPTNIIDALTDPNLLGHLFPNLDTRTAQTTFLKAVYGLPLNAAELAIFQKHTGRTTPRLGGYLEAALIIGRQGGKSELSGSVIAPFEAAVAVLRGEKNIFVPMVAQDTRGSQRVLFSYAVEAIEGSPILSREITRKTATEIELAGRVTIGVYPCRPASLRGIRSAVALVDELGFFLSTDGRPQDFDMLRAIRPTLATTGGRLIILSSPHGMSGALYEMHRNHYGKDSGTLIWQASAPDMNPTLTADYLERMRINDPEGYRAEVLGEFLAGVSTFLNPDALEEVINTGVREIPPKAGVSYVGFVDVASGSGKDSFAVGIAHKQGNKAVLDCIRYWSPPFNPNGTIAEACDLLRQYKIRSVKGDGYAPGFVTEGFATNGINYQKADHNTSDNYLELLPLVNSNSALILDDPRLLKELRGLERHRSRAGRDKVDHRRGSHDDCAVACAGALVSAQSKSRYNLELMIHGRPKEPKPRRDPEAIAMARSYGITVN